MTNVGAGVGVGRANEGDAVGPAGVATGAGADGSACPLDAAPASPDPRVPAGRQPWTTAATTVAARTRPTVAIGVVERRSGDRWVIGPRWDDASAWPVTRRPCSTDRARRGAPARPAR